MNIFEEFKAFVASKPADEAFDSRHNQECALAQFGRMKFGENFILATYSTIRIKSHSYRTSSCNDVYRHEVYMGGSDFFISVLRSKTFGELLTKLEAIPDESFMPWLGRDRTDVEDGEDGEEETDETL